MKNFDVMLAVILPGALKFIGLLLVANFFSWSDVSEFNNYYFIVMLATAIGALPFAAIMTIKNANFSNMGKFALTFVASLISGIAVTAVHLHYELSSGGYLILMLSIFIFGLYEVIKRNALNQRRYKELIYAHIFSLSLLFSLYFVSFAGVEPFWIVVIFFSCLTVPVLFIRLKGDSRDVFLGGMSKYEFLKKYSNSILSSMTSTGLSYFYPLMLIYYLKDDVSEYLSLIFTVSVMFIILPKYISEKDIPSLRSGIDIRGITIKSFKKIITYTLLLVVASLLVVNLVDLTNKYLYWMLFTSIILTQISLPFSNLLMTNGRFDMLLKINLIGVLPFLVVYPFLNLIKDQVFAAHVVSMLFVVNAILRFALSVDKTRFYLKIKY